MPDKKLERSPSGQPPPINPMQQILLIVLLLSSLTFFTTAKAVGVAVTPAEIVMKSRVNDLTTVRLLVKNPSSDVAVFEVYPDEFASFVKANPSSFTLESQTEKMVTIEVTAREEGQFSTALSVVARPLASNAFQAGSGVKVPLLITTKTASGLAAAVSALSTSPWLGVLAFITLLGWGGYKWRAKILKPRI